MINVEWGGRKDPNKWGRWRKRPLSDYVPFHARPATFRKILRRLLLDRARRRTAATILRGQTRPSERHEDVSF